MPRVKVIGLNVTGSSRPAPWILPAISSPYAVAPIRFRCIVPERHRHLLIVRTRHPQAAGGPHCAVQARFPRPPPPPPGLCIVYGGTFHGARIRCIPVPYARFSTSPCKAPSQVLLASLRACSSNIGDEQVSHVLPADALVSVGETRSVP